MPKVLPKRLPARSKHTEEVDTEDNGDMPVKRKKKEDIWRITFDGDIGCVEKSNWVKKSYKVTVVMPDKQVQKGCRTQFLKHYAPKIMPKLYRGWESCFTFNIANATCTNEHKQANTIAVMSRDSLVEFIESNDLPVDQILYPEADDLKQAITECMNPKTMDAFEKNQELRRERIGDSIADEIEALDYIDASIEESLQWSEHANAADDL